MSYNGTIQKEGTEKKVQGTLKPEHAEPAPETDDARLALANAIGVTDELIGTGDLTGHLNVTINTYVGEPEEGSKFAPAHTSITISKLDPAALKQQEEEAAVTEAAIKQYEEQLPPESDEKGDGTTIPDKVVKEGDTDA